MNIFEKLHVVPLLYAAADSLADTVTTDIVNVKGEGCLFVLTKAVGTTGTSTITVDACDTIGPVNTTAVAFVYRISTTPDVWGAWTQATVTGFTTTAGSNQVYQMYIDASELAAEGYGYARLTLDEVADDPVIAGVNAFVVTSYVPQGTSLLD